MNLANEVRARGVRATKGGSVVLDVSHAPIIRVTAEGDVPEEALRVYLADAERLLIKPGAPHVLVYDLLRMHGLGAVHRRIQADWILQNQAVLRKLCLGAGFAMSSAFQRGTLTAVLWLAPLPFQHAVFGTVAEAERWALGRLAQAPQPSRPA